MPVKKDTGSVIAEADGGVGGLLDQNPNIAINAAIIAGKPNITIYKTKRKQFMSHVTSQSGRRY